MTLFLPAFLGRHLLMAPALIVLSFTLAPETARAATAPALLDDFSDSRHNANGIDRLLFDDKGAGSQSHATQKCENGILKVEGELVPGRGVPAFISVVSLLSPDG